MVDRIEVFLNVVGIHWFREKVGDDGVIGIGTGVCENGLGRETTEARVYRECGIGGEARRNGRERAKNLKVVRVIGNAVTSAKKKMKNTQLMVSHCCKQQIEGGIGI